MRKIIVSLFCACLCSAVATGGTDTLPDSQNQVYMTAALSGAVIDAHSGLSVGVLSSSDPRIYPAISAATVAPLTITSGTPPAGKVGKLYGGYHVVAGHAFTGFPLTATGGVPPYKWTATGLPPGLVISVLYFGGSVRCCVYIPEISGAPKFAGTYHPVVTVTDSATPKHHKSVTYAIKIYPR